MHLSELISARFDDLPKQSAMIFSFVSRAFLVFNHVYKTCLMRNEIRQKIINCNFTQQIYKFDWYLSHSARHSCSTSEFNFLKVNVWLLIKTCKFIGIPVLMISSSSGWIRVRLHIKQNTKNNFFGSTLTHIHNFNKYCLLPSQAVCVSIQLL